MEVKYKGGKFYLSEGFNDRLMVENDAGQGFITSPIVRASATFNGMIYYTVNNEYVFERVKEDGDLDTHHRGSRS